MLAVLGNKCLQPSFLNQITLLSPGLDTVVLVILHSDFHDFRIHGWSSVISVDESHCQLPTDSYPLRINSILQKMSHLYLAKYIFDIFKQNYHYLFRQMSCSRENYFLDRRLFFKRNFQWQHLERE